MAAAYRIFKTRFAKTWFDGEGAFLYGGRWNTKGTRILYSAATLSLAVLEMLVHLNASELLSSYSYAAIELAESNILSVEELYALPANWNDFPPPLKAQTIGDRWAASSVSLAMKVPSAVVPGEYNYLINVGHEDFAKIERSEPRRFRFDERLKR